MCIRIQCDLCNFDLDWMCGMCYDFEWDEVDPEVDPDVPQTYLRIICSSCAQDDAFKIISQKDALTWNPKRAYVSIGYLENTSSSPLFPNGCMDRGKTEQCKLPLVGFYFSVQTNNMDESIHYRQIFVPFHELLSYLNEHKEEIKRDWLKHGADKENVGKDEKTKDVPNPRGRIKRRREEVEL